MCGERSWFIRAALIPIIILNLNPVSLHVAPPEMDTALGSFRGLKPRIQDDFCWKCSIKEFLFLVVWMKAGGNGRR